jgi:hypothetical protein
MSKPANLDGAEVYVRADYPDSYGRWYIRSDDSVVYHSPAGEWRETSMVSAEKLRTSPVWAPAEVS